MRTRLTAALLGLLLAVPGAVAAQPSSLLDKLLNAAGEEAPLPPDQAFRLQLVRTADGGVARWDIENEYYLYRHKTGIVYQDRPAAYELPPGRTIHDEFFGESQIFRGRLEVPFTVGAPLQDDGVLSVTYQGCADLGVCYPPITKRFRVMEIAQVPDAPRAERGAPAESAPSAERGAPAESAPSAERRAPVESAPSVGRRAPMESASSAEQRVQAESAPPVSEQFRIAEGLGGQALPAIILSFLGFGLLLALTPCVLPMIPILSGVIVGGGAAGSPRRAVALSSSYVLSMALVYALAGAAVGATGENLQAWLQTPWVIGAFAAVFVLLALSMFGLFELKMPAAVQRRLSGAGRRGRIGGAMLMGAASALIVGPCVTPPLIGALLFIAQTGDALTGGVALFSLGLGMGLPLLAVGTSLGRWLPRPGPVLDRVKVLFGLLLLAVAVWLLDRVVPMAVSQLLAGLLLLGTASYLMGLSALTAGWRHVWRSIGAAAMIYAVLLLIGAASGGTSFLAPLESLTRGGERHPSLPFTRVHSLPAFRLALDDAAAERRPVMLDFYADWCVTCKEMEAFTFSRPAVRQAVSEMRLLQADVTANSEADRALLAHFGIFGPPAILFFDRNGREHAQARVVGFMPADEFAAHVRGVLDHGG